MDGNNSLKRITRVANRQIADDRVYLSDYFLPPAFVDQYTNEVKSSQRTRSSQATDTPTPPTSSPDSGDNDEETGHSTTDDNDTDPTDGDPANKRVAGCVKNWKAAASDEKKKMWSVFNETGIFTAACQHGLILWIADMITSGEL